MGVKSQIMISLIDDYVLDCLLDCIFINNKKFEQLAEKSMEDIVEKVKVIITDKNFTNEEKVDRIKEVLKSNGIDLD